MKDEKAPLVAETPTHVADTTSSLLEIAKQRARQRASEQKVVKIKQGAAKRPVVKPAIDDDENLGSRAEVRARKPADLVSAVLTLPAMPKQKRQLPWP
ncbi:MAG TPA: hypothetical protein VLG73_00420, partial [Shinella sp.]|nr:hypothetical protein [Shinella sp.]